MNERQVLERFNRRLARIDVELREPTWRAEGSATSMSDRDRYPSRSNWTGWLIPGAALLAAAGLLLLAVMPKATPTASVGARPSATPLNDHEVATDSGTITFATEGSELVIRESTGGGTQLLARVAIPVSLPSPGASPVAAGAQGFAMVCGQTGTPDFRRFIFGYLTPFEGGQRTREPDQTRKFFGAPAIGQVASDGLFLFVLLPGPVAPSAMLEVKSEAVGSAIGFKASAFDSIRTQGVRQPSGCYTLD
jgi:hypothetical protein